MTMPMTLPLTSLLSVDAPEERKRTVKRNLGIFPKLAASVMN